MATADGIALWIGITGVATCRARFIVATADLSAPGNPRHPLINLLKLIIASLRIAQGDLITWTNPSTL